MILSFPFGIYNRNESAMLRDTIPYICGFFYGLVRVLAGMQACEMFNGRMGKWEGVYGECVAEDTRDARV